MNIKFLNNIDRPVMSTKYNARLLFNPILLIRLKGHIILLCLTLTNKLFYENIPFLLSSDIPAFLINFLFKLICAKGDVKLYYLL